MLVGPLVARYYEMSFRAKRGISLCARSDNATKTRARFLASLGMTACFKTAQDAEDCQRDAVAANPPILSLNLQPQFSSRPGLRATRRQAARLSPTLGEEAMLKRLFLFIPLFIVFTSFAGQEPGQYQ